MPGQLDIDDEYATQHYLWSLFNAISAMIMLTYGVSASRPALLLLAAQVGGSNSNSLQHCFCLMTHSCHKDLPHKFAY